MTKAPIQHAIIFLEHIFVSFVNKFGTTLGIEDVLLLCDGEDITKIQGSQLEMTGGGVRKRVRDEVLRQGIV